MKIRICYFLAVPVVMTAFVFSAGSGKRDPKIIAIIFLSYLAAALGGLISGGADGKSRNAKAEK